jgi:thioredoxin 1
MYTKFTQQFTIIAILLLSFMFNGCVQNTTDKGKQKTLTEEKQSTQKHKVTFIELGSVRCIPCQKMQPIMDSVEKKYAGQVKVVFYDVWTAEGRPYADKYNIEVIPTQVFLDENGKEYFRHQGFFPEEELVKVLKQKGVN